MNKVKSVVRFCFDSWMEFVIIILIGVVGYGWLIEDEVRIVVGVVSAGLIVIVLFNVASILLDELKEWSESE
jgi:hypothetical protein